ncbi:MAG: OprO/OprP family phosphate-selective porin [Bacteroidota bacterium]|nr:OprO/OprP family phosphate-selective porin [Bacteroidota bacterium]
MSFLRSIVIVLLLITSSKSGFSQDSVKAEAPKKQWYETIRIRGYTQIRYNGLIQTNPLLQCEQCDRSWGGDGGFFIRRARMIFFGQVHERVYIYIQPDFASTPSGNVLNFVQLRDAYFDVSLDKKREFRFRIGQSKVPFGFENLQSSQNRIPLDRNDALNSAVANERDLGVFFYYAPEHIRERFSYLVNSGLKGSGDYGVLGFGAYNGQTANRPEANDNRHLVARLTYPFKLKNGQIIEPGIQAYTGKFTLLSRSTDIVGETEFIDRRIAGTLVVYPQPFGIQAEYNVGEGPEFNPQMLDITTQRLHGGYVLTSYMIKKKGQFIFPFSRFQYYKGGKKHELDARKHIVKELEIGIEWQPVANFELVAMYTFSDRTFEDFKNPVNQQAGNLLRLQLQINY